MHLGLNLVFLVPGEQGGLEIYAREFISALHSESESELAEPQLRPVFDLVVRTHPSFTRFVVEDDWFRWAYKRPEKPRTLQLRTNRSVAALVAGRVRTRARRRDLERRARQFRERPGA